MKQVLHQLGRYRKDTFLCIAMAALEVLMEILLPFITAIIIDQGLEAANLSVVYRYGAAVSQPAGGHLCQDPDLLLFQH